MSDSGRGQPFGEIGLSLSGGGFRASAFHLGTLDALERLGLLADVGVLSTVSGGSFTGAAYALALARGQRFESFFADFYRFLERNDLPERVIAALKNGCSATPSRRRALITAAAEAYHRGFLGGARFGELLAARTHLKELIVNATELRTGVPFRFRTSAKPRVRIGNGNVAIPRAAAARLRVADVVAASSCFPGGFEPLVLPDDFGWSDESPAELPPELASFEPVALMDGGLTDNQGVGSLRLADSCTADLGLVVISDTDRTVDELFRPLTAAPGTGVRLWLLAALASVATLVAGAAGVFLVASGTTAALRGELSLPRDLLARLVPALACLGWAAAGLGCWWALRSALRRHLPRELRRPVLAAVGRLGLREAIGLATVRLRSLAAMASHVFTRRIRRQVFDAAYEDEAYRDRLIANLIYRLPRGRAEGPQPSPALLAVAERAAAMPTTLWFEDAGQLPDVVAAGQATFCHALLGHVARRDLERDAAVQPVAARARELWQRLCEEPRALAEERLGGSARSG